MLDGGRLCLWVGVSCLISVVALSQGMRQLICGRRACASLAKSFPSPVLFSSLWGLAILTKIKSQMRNCHTLFGILTYIQTTGWVNQCFIADADTLVLM